MQFADSDIRAALDELPPLPTDVSDWLVQTGTDSADEPAVTFNYEGQPQFAPELGEEARLELRWYEPIPLTDQHRERLAWHREAALQL